MSVSSSLITCSTKGCKSEPYEKKIEIVGTAPDKVTEVFAGILVTRVFCMHCSIKYANIVVRLARIPDKRGLDQGGASEAEIEAEHFNKTKTM